MVDKLMRFIFNIKEVKFRNDDDFVDRLTRRHTTSILLLFSLVITTKQYVGEPIYCWCPAHFTDSHKAYSNMICWVKNTYYVPWDDHLPSITGQKKAYISYYQWVPMILLCQALLCYFPSMVWRFLCRRSGLHLAAIVDAAIAGQRTTYADIREKTTRYMVHQIDKYLVNRMERKRGCCTRLKQMAARNCCLIVGRFTGNYLTACYIFYKMLFIANAIGQLYLLDVFMGSEYHLYGLHVVNRFVKKDDWTQSQRFPRVTMCDFQIRHQTQLHRYIVQCVLPVNLFNEKIFIFIWFWFAFLCCMTVSGAIKWLWNLAFWPAQIKYVRQQLRNISHIKREGENIAKFTNNYLKRDGVFVLRLLGNNVGHLVAAEVTNGLWNNYGPEHKLLAGDSPSGIVASAPPPAAASGTRPQRTVVRLNSLAERLENV